LIYIKDWSRLGNSNKADTDTQLDKSASWCSRHARKKADNDVAQAVKNVEAIKVKASWLVRS